MNGKKFLNALICICSMMALGCANGEINKKVDKDVAAETSVNSGADLRANTNKTLQDTSLTDAQRTQLKELRDSTRTQLQALSQQSLKLRAVLIKDVMAQNYNDDEVSAVKGKIKDVEGKRLTVMFSAVDKANTILGHQSDYNRQVMDDFWRESMSRNEF